VNQVYYLPSRDVRPNGIKNQGSKTKLQPDRQASYVSRMYSSTTGIQLLLGTGKEVVTDCSHYATDIWQLCFGISS
jgi:hypothetical protein